MPKMISRSPKIISWSPKMAFVIYLFEKQLDLTWFYPLGIDWIIKTVQVIVVEIRGIGDISWKFKLLYWWKKINKVNFHFMSTLVFCFVFSGTVFDRSQRNTGLAKCFLWIKRSRNWGQTKPAVSNNIRRLLCCEIQCVSWHTNAQEVCDKRRGIGQINYHFHGTSIGKCFKSLTHQH